MKKPALGSSMVPEEVADEAVSKIITDVKEAVEMELSKGHPIAFGDLLCTFRARLKEEQARRKTINEAAANDLKKAPTPTFGTSRSRDSLLSFSMIQQIPS